VGTDSSKRAVRTRRSNSGQYGCAMDEGYHRVEEDHSMHGNRDRHGRREPETPRLRLHAAPGALSPGSIGTLPGPLSARARPWRARSDDEEFVALCRGFLSPRSETSCSPTFFRLSCGATRPSVLERSACRPHGRARGALYASRLTALGELCARRLRFVVSCRAFSAMAHRPWSTAHDRSYPRRPSRGVPASPRWSSVGRPPGSCSTSWR
jgi:hypothetical protein